MGTSIRGWEMRSPGEPLVEVERVVDAPASGQVVVAVAGCGVCHTDVGYLFDGVRTRHPLPLTLGHEVAGTVIATGEGAAELDGRKVVVPAVIPCGECSPCRRGRGGICAAQVFVGCDVHGGFASHLVVPARGLCTVDDADLAASGVALADLGVLADAITTPYQAILRSGLQEGDVAVFVGAGGVGGFGVQIARALGARVVAIDVDPERLALMAAHGAELTLDARAGDARALRGRVRDWAKAEKLPAAEWRIFETSGSAAGQELAFGLLGPGAWLGVVGYTLDAVSVKLSNLMAFDATAQGNWGCLPEHYPGALDLVLAGDVVIEPFIERFPLRDVNRVLTDVHAHRLRRRPLLIP
ncbi:MAG TPA: 6-hydroxycyclohex-1-ene-1-carbonyl-CoA dehydrogenase [Kofleriaceae bacterium]|nr:6-hydroxycyclohex-1-ene-1-carbonyl-CoA dehydrogenase [Kofleriaceae bacterium]